MVLTAVDTMYIRIFFFLDLTNKELLQGGGGIAQGSILASQSAAPGLIPSMYEIFSEANLSMLLRLINGMVRGKGTVA